jgi:hypothetical protein
MHAAAAGPATHHVQGEANELRKQLSLARSLRSGSSPEFDEKMTRLKQLREMRKGYLDKIQGACAEDPSCMWQHIVCTRWPWLTWHEGGMWQWGCLRSQSNPLASCGLTDPAATSDSQQTLPPPFHVAPHIACSP